MKHKIKRIRNFAGGILISSFISIGFATLLATLKIPTTVVLPTTAPIWVGMTTMIYMILE